MIREAVQAISGWVVEDPSPACVERALDLYVQRNRIVLQLLQQACLGALRQMVPTDADARDNASRVAGTAVALFACEGAGCVGVEVLLGDAFHGRYWAPTVAVVALGRAVEELLLSQVGAIGSTFRNSTRFDHGGRGENPARTAYLPANSCYGPLDVLFHLNHRSTQFIHLITRQINIGWRD